jgi:hypothetical protein
MRATERKLMSRYFFKDEREQPVDGQINAVLEEMRTVGVSSDRYPVLMSYLERLTEVKKKANRAPVSRDTMALIAGNLMGILLIVVYEQKHVLSSKGFNQIIRPSNR